MELVPMSLVLELLFSELILFLLALYLSALTLLVKSCLPDWSWRMALLTATVISMTGVYSLVEILSLFAGVTRIWIVVFSVTALSVALLLLYLRRGQICVEMQRSNGYCTFTLYSPAEKVIVACLLLLTLPSALTAFWAAPNTWDSLTYHMSRVMHWIQNGSVNFYATHILRQLHLGPGAEVAVLFLQLINGNDRLANFVQYFAMLASTVGVTRISMNLGANRAGQLVAALATCSIPMGAIQATSTQNDYVVALWLVCFTGFWLEYAKTSSVGYSVFAGLSLGLGLLTKATTFLFALPIAIFMTLVCIRRYGAKGVATSLLIVVLAVALNGGHLVRNYLAFSNLLGPGQEEDGAVVFKYTNDAMSPRLFVSNVLRNLALHVGLPDAFLPDANRFSQSGIFRFHDLIGIPLNDGRTTWPGTSVKIELSLSENSAGNPVHLVLLVASGLAITLAWRRHGLAFGYISSLFMGFCFFCLVLKWQPWHSRLHLPLFVLGASVIGLGVEKRVAGSLITFVCAILAINAMPAVLCNDSRPLVCARSILLTDRIDQMLPGPRLRGEYEQAMRVVGAHECKTLGINIGLDDPEYPLWILADSNRLNLSIEHVQVLNVSSKYELQYPPCAIIARRQLPESFVYGGVTYLRALDNDMSVYVTQP